MSAEFSYHPNDGQELKESDNLELHFTIKQVTGTNGCRYDQAKINTTESNFLPRKHKIKRARTNWFSIIIDQLAQKP